MRGRGWICLSGRSFDRRRDAEVLVYLEGQVEFARHIRSETPKSGAWAIRDGCEQRLWLRFEVRDPAYEAELDIAAVLAAGGSVPTPRVDDAEVIEVAGAQWPFGVEQGDGALGEVDRDDGAHGPVPPVHVEHERDCAESDRRRKDREQLSDRWVRDGHLASGDEDHGRQRKEREHD